VKESIRGDIVIVQEQGGSPLVRRVWDANDQAVFVCSEERYNDLLNEKDNRYPMGFPREYVFEYDESVLGTLGSLWQVTPSVWGNLHLWDKDDGEE
jgi:hypothetical protein